MASICENPKLVIRNKQISVESVSNTEPNTSILASAIRFQLPKTRGKTLEAVLYRDLMHAQQGLMSLFQSLGMVGLHRRSASVDMLKKCPCKNGIFKKPKICSANCAIHEHGVKHEKPCAIRAFRPNCKQFELPRRAERQEPSRLGAAPRFGTGPARV